jgi:hypothetical protein
VILIARVPVMIVTGVRHTRAMARIHHKSGSQFSYPQTAGPPEWPPLTGIPSRPYIRARATGGNRP